METLTWLSVLPPVITIAFAIWSKKILPSLLLGLLVGSYLLDPSIIGGLEVAIENILKILSDTSNLQVLLFLYLFNGLITLIKNAGGIKAFSSWLGKYIKSDRGVFYTLWALIPVTFIDCDFRIVGAGSIMRSLAEKHKIAKERLAFMINNTASPVLEVIPIATTFVGFNIANISQGLESAGVLEEQSAYSVLLRAIPFEFYSIVVLLITFSTIFFQWRKQPLGKQGEHYHKETADEMSMSMGDEKPQIKPRIINLIVPMLTVVSLCFFFFWYFGRGENGVNETIASIISATDPNMAMLVALSISIFITGLLYAFQKYPLKKMTEDMISGGNELMRILIILVIAWALGDVSQELGLSDFIQQLLGNQLPIWSIPVSLFLISSLVTYFIGEGWATASLIMPFAIFIAVSSGVSIPICVAAVITGGTFGDTTSPVAGMTNMASGVTGADHMKYLKYANPYNFASAGIAAVLFLIAGFLYHQ
ncbi:MAG: Na+/H+ antiporter NhaC family protein [Patescibacteria group bacterium]|mgnify:CR=1 FL=1|jgi:Na+/H+ antiporter NhaC